MSERPYTPAVDMSRPVHVLFLIDQLCETGGAERVLLQTIRLLQREHFRCSLATFKIDKSHELFRDLPCPCRVYPLKRTYDWNAIKIAVSIRRFIRKEAVQIVHTFHETSDLWGGLVARMAGRPSLVSSRRDMGILRRPKHAVAYRLMNRVPDLVLTVSEQVRRFCIETDRLPPERVFTLYNGLELEAIEKATGAAGFPGLLPIGERTRIILTVGHIRRVKGIDILVETAARVTKAFPDAMFLVVGRDCEQEHVREIKSRIRELHLEPNVRFLGETKDIYPLLKLATMFFLPSRSEGFSNALIEAMACGLPSVVTDVGGNSEAIENGRTGYVVENEDVEAAADRILQLLHNPAEMTAMGSEARKVAQKRFTAQAMLENLMAQYRRLLSRN